MRFRLSALPNGKYEVYDMKTGQKRFGPGSLDGARQAQAQLEAANQQPGESQ